MKLYEMTSDFTEMFDRFEEIDSWEPDTDELGRPIDSEGNIIENVLAYKQAMINAWFDTLEAIEEAFEEKAINTALYIKSLRSDEEQLKAEKARIDRRMKQKNRLATKLEDYLLREMQAIGREKIECPQVLIKVKKNPERTVIDNEEEFIAWAQEHGYDYLLRYSQPEPRKSDIKTLLKDNREIPFARLERKTVVSIK